MKGGCLLLLIVALPALASTNQLYYLLYMEQYDNAVSWNSKQRQQGAISQAEFRLNKQFIAFYRRVDGACPAAPDWPARLAGDRRVLALLYFCFPVDFISHMERLADREQVFPLYLGLFLLQKQQYNRAAAAFNRINPNRLSRREKTRYLRALFDMYLKAKDVQRLVYLLQEYPIKPWLADVMDINLLRRMSLQRHMDKSLRNVIVNRTVRLLKDSRRYQLLTVFLQKLRARGYVSRTYAARTLRQMRNTQLTVWVDCGMDNSEHLQDGLAAYARQGMHAPYSLVTTGEGVDYIIACGRNVYAQDSRVFYLHGPAGGEQALSPVVSLAERMASLRDAFPGLRADTTLVTAQHSDDKQVILAGLPGVHFAGADRLPVMEWLLKDIRTLIVSAGPEQAYILLNALNMKDLPAMERVVVLNDMSGYHSRLKWFRYNQLVWHIPVTKRVKSRFGANAVPDKYFLLGYDIGAMIEVVSGKKPRCDGVFAGYELEGGVLRKRVQYEKLFFHPAVY